jgi:Domain of unknown function (DUF1929)
MRKLATALLAAGISLGPVAAIVPASAADDPAATKGQFTTPFREDIAPYDAATNTFGGERGDTGCLPVDANGHRDCLPAGASENVLADGRVLYWNAIEGAEDLDDPMEAAVPSGGDLARDDRSRVLSLNWDNPLASTWAEPENPTGYFEGTPSEPPLIPGTNNDNNSEDRDYASNGSLFCSDQKQLADGTILAAGGTNYYAEPRLDPKTGVIELEGVRNARIFNPEDDTWNKTGDLNYGRWYPSMVTLPDGDLFIASGVTKLIKPLYPWRAVNTDDPAASDPTQLDESGDNVPQTETYDVDTGTWTENGASAERSLPLFPRLHLLPNGNVYYDAAGQSFNPMGQSYKQALWNIAATYNPSTKAWTNLGVPGLQAPNTGSSNIAEPGFRGSTFSQALPFRPNQAGEYNKASYLTAGGVTLMSPGSYFPTDSTRINTVDVSGGAETLSTTPAEKLGRARWYSSAVTLPTGQVLAVSGADVDEVASPGMESPIRQSELFTPEYDDEGNYVGGKWDDAAIQNRKRTYHNNAVLLPDGRVLIGGHAPIPHGYYNVRNNPDVPGVREASNNYKDASFELYEPPYLHWGEQRPVIGNMDPTIKTSQGKIIVPTSDAASIKEVVLVRNPSETHLIDADQRNVVLPVKGFNGVALEVDVPNNPALLPNGPYMLFINKQTTKGLVPSVAKQVFVDAEVPGWSRGADTYPTDETAATSAPSGGGVIASLPSAESVAATVTEAVEANAPAGLNAKAASSERESRTPMLGLAGVAFLIAMASLAGTRRRSRVPVRIKK